ncbi:MAG: AAA family ATPase, partial [Xanthobacteraceae bacterium]
MAEPQGSGVAWPPPGIPHDACVFQLEKNSKRPPFGAMGAHHNAVPWQQALLVPGPAASYGIRLDNQFLLADCDVNCPEAAEALLAFPTTWRQTTRRGWHLDYRQPPGFIGKNCDWYYKGVKIGQLKIKGYQVGPGSMVDGHIYALLDNRDPVPAPPELLAACEQAVAAPAQEINTRDRIAEGERDDELTSIAGFFRRHGYTEDVIRAALWGIVRSGIVEQPIGNEILESTCAKIAHSAIKYSAEVPVGRLTPSAWRCATEVEMIGPPFEWLILNYLPKAELSLVYGEGGCGKSSWGSWLADEVTNKHGVFLFAGIEEPFERFAQRAVQSGAREDRLFELQEAHRLVFPRDCDALEEALMLAKPACLYFDSIYTHFPADDRTNMAERTRHVLGPLAGVAQRTGTTIVGIFHENRAGTYNGSAEMRNVARSLLHAQRNEGSDCMTLRVDKPFIRDPKLLATFIGDEVIKMDPGTGRV